MRLIVFDVNETLLDVSAMSRDFATVMGSGISMREWFSRLLHRSVVANHLGRYQPFDELGVEALIWLAARDGISVDPEDARRLVAGMRRLPPHPDVVPGLASLHTMGHRLVALSNGSTEALAAQMEVAGIAGYFERVMSVDGVRRFKPSPEVYLHAAAVCGVDIDRMLMVAAHDWDVAGAQSVGARGCFIRRQPWGIAGVEPFVAVDEIGDIVAVVGPSESGDAPVG